MQFYFILNKPAVAENIGFCCRAIKTMGFTRLRIVAPGVDPQSQPARNTAYQAHDVLLNAPVFSSLSAALADVDLAIGTTAKSRSSRKDTISVENLNQIISQKKGLINHVAIVFGSEENGLSNEELMLCDIVSYIPMHTVYPSLNLSHSVQLYAYELASFARETTSSTMAVHGEQPALKQLALEVLRWLEVNAHGVLHQRIMDRLMLTGVSDSRLLLSLGRFFKRKMKGGR